MPTSSSVSVKNASKLHSSVRLNRGAQGSRPRDPSSGKVSHTKPMNDSRLATDATDATAATAATDATAATGALKDRAEDPTATFSSFLCPRRPDGVLTAFLILLALLFAGPSIARADSTFSGKWRQGPLIETYTLQTWISGCGAVPASGRFGGGEVVVVHADGDELVLVGGGRMFATNQCYDPLPTLKREAHTRDPSGRMWRTRCATPQGDPRHAQMQTLVTATSDTRLEVAETGRYEIVLAEGRCVADVKRTRTFEAVPAQPDAVVLTPTAVARPIETALDATTGACESPSEPARLEVRPSRKLLRPGESFAFRAIVRDAAGCVTRTATSWSMAPSADGVARVKVDTNGKVTVVEDPVEGSAEVIATAAGRSARVSIEVTSAARYDDLLAQSGLNAAGENDATTVTILESESIGGRDTPAEDSARKRKSLFICVVLAVVAVLGSLAFFGARRARKAARLEAKLDAEHAETVRLAESSRRARIDEHAAQVRAHEESARNAQLAKGNAPKREVEAVAIGSHDSTDVLEMVCASCGRKYPRTTAYCPHDGGKLSPQAVRLAPSNASARICPRCSRGFGAETRYCPFDEEELSVPASPASSYDPPTVRGKVCPTCGGRFEGNATFCGTDGTTLVLLN
jgi:hypothetical protein